jgi:phage-related protein
MTDIHLPDYPPVYPLSKKVMPKHRQARLPERGIEQRKTFGLNQTAPEWDIRWVLRPEEADALDAFFAERAHNNEWFLWRPPYHNQGRYRCDDWTKTPSSCAHSQVQATVRQVFSFNFPSFRPTPAPITVTGTSTRFLRGYVTTAASASFALTGTDAALSKTRPIYADTGTFTLTALPASLLRNYYAEAQSGGFALTGNAATFIYVSLQSDYFSSMSSQIWGWDRDFQVDWWGD